MQSTSDYMYGQHHLYMVTIVLKNSNWPIFGVSKLLSHLVGH